MNFTLATATDFLHSIAENKVEFNVCELNSKVQYKITDVNPLSNNDSGSYSEVVFANIIDTLLKSEEKVPVAIKIFFDSNENMGLKYEAKIYKFITDNVDGKSPNFIRYIGYSECSPLDSNLNMLTNVQKKKILEKTLSPNKVCTLITEMAGNGKYFGLNELGKTTSLKKFLKTNPPEKDLNKIMFQLVYSLQLMNEWGLMHNDFHNENIMISEFSEEIDLVYYIYGIPYFIRTRYILYIFDWDWGFLGRFGDNKNLYNFSHFDITNKFSPKSDLYVALCQLSQMKAGDKISKKYFQGIQQLKEYEDFFTAKNLINTLDRENFPIYLKSEKGDPVYKIPRDKFIREFVSSLNFDFNPTPRPEHKEMVDDIYQSYKDLNIEDFQKILDTLSQRRKWKYLEFLQSIKNMTYVMIVFEGDSFKLYNPISCRLTNVDFNFPTPLDVLQNDFSEYIIDEKNIPKNAFKFRLTRQNIPKSIYKNKNIKTGRETLERLKIRPRFPAPL